jgi:hypothetical protein
VTLQINFIEQANASKTTTASQFVVLICAAKTDGASLSNTFPWMTTERSILSLRAGCI